MLLEKLSVIEDREPRSAAMNMAMDEALLLHATGPTLRAYRWATPAISFGYFELYKKVRETYPDRELIRRWTGGGMVDHTDDFTYSLVIPSEQLGSAREVYAAVHSAVALALGNGASLASSADQSGGFGCFANPVRDDVLLAGRKVAGAAQRRTRRGLLLQGSVSGVGERWAFATALAEKLSAFSVRQAIEFETLEFAKALSEQKYGTEAWVTLRR